MMKNGIIILKLSKVISIVFQHECDHLDGIIYVDRLKDTKLLDLRMSLTPRK